MAALLAAWLEMGAEVSLGARSMDWLRGRTLLVFPLLVPSLALLEPAAAWGAEASASSTRVGAAPRLLAQEPRASASQFTDVLPTDWAYQALSSLVERYGCVAGVAHGTFAGGKPISRFEAAALLNACLDRVTETTDALKALLSEFSAERAILQGRLQGLDRRVGVLEANPFATTTKLAGKAQMVFGGVRNALETDDIHGTAEPFPSRPTFNYNIQLSLDTSFSGKDLLRTRLRAGNFNNSVFGHGNSLLELATDAPPVNDVVGIDRLFYQFPIGEHFTATLGALVRQDDMLAMVPGLYPKETILDMFSYSGLIGSYSSNLGPGVGLWYQNNGFSVSLNYVSDQHDGPNSSYGVAKGETATVQVGYAKQNWGVAFVYTYAAQGALDPVEVSDRASNNVGLSGYWQPLKTGWIPSMTAGIGYDQGLGQAQPGTGNADLTWTVGLQWEDALVKGNTLGLAVGSTDYASDFMMPTAMGFEVWYLWQISDQIGIQPAFFWLQNQYGYPDTVGALVRTTFKF